MQSSPKNEQLHYEILGHVATQNWKISHYGHATLKKGKVKYKLMCRNRIVRLEKHFPYKHGYPLEVLIYTFSYPELLMDIKSGEFDLTKPKKHKLDLLSF